MTLAPSAAFRFAPTALTHAHQLPCVANETKTLSCCKDDRAMRFTHMSALKIFGKSLTMPPAIFPEILNRLFFRLIDAKNMRTKFEVRSFTCS